MDNSMSEEELLQSLPLQRTWLSDIVDALMAGLGGQNDIEGVLIHIMKHTQRDLGKEGAATITRTINNYCENSGDSERECTAPLFRRVGPGQYRLLTYPKRPDLIELQQVQFADAAFGRLWEWYVEQVSTKPRWLDMTKRQRLATFAAKIATNDAVKKQLEIFRNPIDLADLGL